MVNFLQWVPISRTDKKFTRKIKANGVNSNHFVNYLFLLKLWNKDSGQKTHKIRYKNKEEDTTSTKNHTLEKR